jgi:L-alanine-DL-glutamate epimerase-like enolase superfamily enzyme
MLHAYGVEHLEEPCPYWELDWTAQVRAASEVPVAGGEQDYDLQQWRRIIGMHTVDIVQPDICYIGGLTRALRVANMARQAGLPCVPHSANRSMVTVFALHMMGAIANPGRYVEFSIEPTSWVDALFTPALVARGGEVEIPAGPGWGVELNERWLAGAKRQVSAAHDVAGAE